MAGSLPGPAASRDSQSPRNGAVRCPRAGTSEPPPRWPKIKPEKASLAQHPAGCTGPSQWVPARLGAALARMKETLPGSAAFQGKQEGGVPALAYSAAFVPCLLLAWGSHWGGSARTIPHCPRCRCATLLPVGRRELARTPRLSGPLGEEISAVGLVGGAWVWCGCLFGIQGRNATPRWDVPRQPLCPGVPEPTSWGRGAASLGAGVAQPEQQLVPA